MLETIREYAWERLHESSEAEQLHRRHAQFFLELARSANLNAGDLAPGGQKPQLAFTEQDNFRSALTWALRTGAIDFGLELANALEQFWVANDPGEGVRWYRAPSSTGGQETPRRRYEHTACARSRSSSHIAGDPAAASGCACRASRSSRSSGDEHGRAVILHRLSITAMMGGDLELARELVGGKPRASRSKRRLVAEDVGPSRRPLGTLARSPASPATTSSRSRLLSESAELARAAGVEWWQGGVLAEIAAIALRRGSTEEAERQAHAPLRSQRASATGRAWSSASGCTPHWRPSAATSSTPDAVGRDRGRAGIRASGRRQRHRNGFAARLRELGDGSFDTAVPLGRELELTDAVEEALRGG